MKRALKVLADREVSPQLGLLKSTLLQLDSAFSERDYGVSTFRDFIEKFAKTGIVTLRHAGRSTIVDMAEGPADAGEAAVQPPASVESASAPEQPAEPAFAAGSPATAAQPPRDPEQVQQAVTQARALLDRAPQSPRWPMYIRQLKQYLRTADSSFDERRLGFSNLMDFLRVCQREGLFRLERDRRGQMRVFPGPALQPSSRPAPQQPGRQEAFAEPVLDAEAVEPSPSEPVFDLEEVPVEIRADEAAKADEIAAEVIEVDEAAPAPVRAERARKSSASRRVRKPARAKPASRRRKAPVPA